MRTGKSFLLAATVTSVVFLFSGIGTLSAKADKPDPHKPVSATDTVLVEKISLQGGQPRAATGGQKKVGAATGFLGQVCNGRRYAIVVGISEYPGSVNDLQYAAKDALDMVGVLKDTYGFDSITTLTDKAATRSAILTAIDTVRLRAGPDDEVAFFFSGHGMNGVANDGDTERVDEAIVVNDASNPFKLAPIWDGELRRAFSGFQTSRIIFIFDTCMAGGMDDLQAPGRVILAASTERGYAYEGPEWGNGEFTYYLTEGITTGYASVYSYGFDMLSVPPQLIVTAEEAFDYAKANCTVDNPVIVDSFPNDLLP
jgi:hypothetical protein